ncbi:sperm flagellar protein 1-like [Teleopsis dalmanni]|uniref:sperm flagellar protein 1-like n=1 Tax=Teleopsis dalmanni TaxID=139649 RepID=UPI0018CD9347|nr:sperm flagellar protein 1-like [Teleopsis dalmanni]
MGNGTGDSTGDSTDDVTVDVTGDTTKDIGNILTPRKKLSEKRSEVLQWLKENDITFKDMRREFSNAVLMAKLLKRCYPTLVDLHNYPKTNCFNLKLHNWRTLNVKVLVKISVRLSQKQMEMLAKAVPGKIEALLYCVMMLEKGKVERMKELNFAYGEKSHYKDEECVLVTPNVETNDGKKKLHPKRISYTTFLETASSVNTMKKQLEEAEKKIELLEHFVKEKNELIEFLCTEISTVIDFVPNSHVDK